MQNPIKNSSAISIGVFLQKLYFGPQNRLDPISINGHKNRNLAPFELRKDIWVNQTARNPNFTAKMLGSIAFVRKQPIEEKTPIQNPRGKKSYF